MKIGLLFLSGFFSIMLRDTIFNDLSVAGGKPDFILLIVVFFAIFNGSTKGGWLGLGLGLMEDLLLGRFIGINALCKGIIGFAVGYTERRVYKDNFFVPILCLLIGSLIHSALYFIFSNVIGSTISIVDMASVSIPDAVYSSCFAPIIYAAFHKAHTKKEGT